MATKRGLPGLEEMRSMNRNGLSLITLVFTDKPPMCTSLGRLVLERMIEVGEQIAGRRHAGARPRVQLGAR